MSISALQTAVVTKLKVDSGVDALVGDRIYDNVPASPTFPYLSLGSEQVEPDRAECITGFIVHFQIDAWSRTVGFPQVKQISSAIIAALNDAALTVTGHRLVDLYLENESTSRDPDGLTSHAAITFRALVEPV
jgi:hypothetical protein